MPQPNGPVVVVLEKVDDYQAQLAAGIRAELAPRGVPLLIHLTGVREGAPPSLARLLERGTVGGMIITAETNPATHAAVNALVDAAPGLPVVRIAQQDGGVTVGADNAHGMWLVAHHLVEQGARQVLAVRGKPHQPDSAEREAALRGTLAELGVPLPDSLVVDGGFSRSQTFAAVRDLLARGPAFDAVAAFNDASALGAVDALAEAGLRVPEDVLVSGFDDDAASAFSRPSLTTVDQNLAEQGATAARLLLDLMSGHRPRSVVVPVRLRHRESTRGPATHLDRREWMQARLAALDTALDLSRSLLASPSVEALIDQIAAQLPRLGIDRAFLVLRSETPGVARGVVALSHEAGSTPRAGLEDTDGDESFDLADLLPPRLSHHLRHGALVLQPLVVGETELGYLLLDQVLGAGDVVSDVLCLDLTRALDSLRATRQITRHADDLEALVAERTRQLSAEVATRRQAEAELRRVNAELLATLDLDRLTGLGNRAAFEKALATQWSGHSRSGQPLSLLMIDVDHFKAFNDRYGQPQGDEVLRTVARCLQAAIRRLGDTATRVGGEEFAMLLPNTGADGALVVARRLRRLVAGAAISHEDSPVQQRLTVSIGVATTYPDPLSDAEDLVAAADAALYDVKDAGRDGIAGTRGQPRLTPTAAHPTAAG
jgi:diguanylate cyclase (GGDEF)-like protein